VSVHQAGSGREGQDRGHPEGDGVGAALTFPDLPRLELADHHRLNHPNGPDHPTSTTHWIDLLRSSDRTS
jgi:hypothetical protein